MNTVFKTTFTVMPSDTNPMFPLIFGGAFFSHLDLCAAQTVNRFLYSSHTAETAVTYKFEGTFLKPCYAGDLLFLEGEIENAGHKSIIVLVKAYREKVNRDQNKVWRELVAEARFVFVSILPTSMHEHPALLPYYGHGLTLKPQDGVSHADSAVCSPSDYFG